MNKEPFKNKAYLTIWHKPQTTGIIASHGKGCSRTAPLFDLFGEGFMYCNLLGNWMDFHGVRSLHEVS